MPFYVNPIFPEIYPNVNSTQNSDIKDLKAKVNNLEKEIYNLKNKITKLESTNSNYVSNYKINSYNMI